MADDSELALRCVEPKVLVTPDMIKILNITEQTGFSLPPTVSALNRYIYLHLKPCVRVNTAERGKHVSNDSDTICISRSTLLAIGETRTVTKAVVWYPFSRFSDISTRHLRELTVVWCFPNYDLSEFLMPQRGALDSISLELGGMVEVPPFLFQLQTKEFYLDISSTWSQSYMDAVITSQQAQRVCLVGSQQQLHLPQSSPFLEEIDVTECQLQLPLRLAAQVQSLVLFEIHFLKGLEHSDDGASLLLACGLKTLKINSVHNFQPDLLSNLPESLEHLSLTLEEVDISSLLLPGRLHVLDLSWLSCENLVLPISLRSLRSTVSPLPSVLRSLLNLEVFFIEQSVYSHAPLSAADLPQHLLTLHCGILTEAEALPSSIRNVDARRFKTSLSKIDLPSGLVHLRLQNWDCDLSPLPAGLESLKLGYTWATDDDEIGDDIDDHRFLGILPCRLKMLVFNNEGYGDDTNVSFVTEMNLDFESKINREIELRLPQSLTLISLFRDFLPRSLKCLSLGIEHDVEPESLLPQFDKLFTRTS